MNAKFLLSAALAAFASITTSHATLIAGVTVEDSSSSNGGFSRQDFNSINGSGLTGLQHTSNPANAMWMTSTGGSDLTPEIIYDLGAVYNIDRMRVWNYNEGYNNGSFVLTDRGLNRVTVTFGETLSGATASNPTGTNLPNTLAGVTTFAQATGLNSYEGEEFTFSTISARYVKIQALSNHGSTDVSGLSEVQFFIAPIPEPSTTLLFGIGGLAMLLRRRK